MLLAPSFSPKAQTVLDCLFNAVRALSGRSCPSTSRSVSWSVVLAMPEEAWEAWPPKLLVHPRALTDSPGEGYSTLHARGSFPKALLDLGWCEDLQKVPLLPRSSSLLLCSGLLWAAVPGHHGQGRGQEGSTAVPGSPALCCSTNTDSSALASLTQWINNHRHLREPHGIGSDWAFWSRTCFLYFQHCSFSCEQTPSSKCVPPYGAENLYKNCVLDLLNRWWFL